MTGLLALSVAFTAWTSFGTPLGPDAGYYAGYSREAGAGRVPFVDFPFAYTPAFLYFQQMLEPIFGLSRWGLHKEVWTLHLLVLALVLGALRTVYRLPLAGLMLAAAIHLPITGRLDGSSLVLEPFVNFWGWSAVLLSLAAGSRMREAIDESRQAPPRDRASPPDMQTLALAAAAGVAAGLSAWTKQVGVVFGGLATVCPYLVSGKFSPRVALSALTGFFLIPLGFFGFYPETFVPMLDATVAKLFRYALDVAPQGYANILAKVLVRGWMPLVLALALLAASRRLARRRRALADAALDPGGLPHVPAAAPGDSGTGSCSKDRLTAAFALSGLVLYLSFPLKGWAHYLQLVLPFALLCSAREYELVRAETSGRGRLAFVALLFLAGTAIDLSFLCHYRLASPTLWEREEGIVEWIAARSANDHRGLLVAPAAPHLMLLSGRRPCTGLYEFHPTIEDLRLASDLGSPCFVYLRAGIDVSGIFEELRSLGYREVDRREGEVSLWRPARLEAPSCSRGPGSEAVLGSGGES